MAWTCQRRSRGLGTVNPLDGTRHGPERGRRSHLRIQRRNGRVLQDDRGRGVCSIAVLSRMDDDAQEGRLAAMREIRRLKTGRVGHD